MTRFLKKDFFHQFKNFPHESGDIAHNSYKRTTQMVTVVDYNTVQVKADKKQKTEKVPVLHSFFEECKPVFESVISTDHPELADAKIVYMCRNFAQKKGGKVLPGSVKRPNPHEVELARDRFDGSECSFIVTIALDVWNEYDQSKRLALADHLLTRCVAVEDEKNGSMKYSLRSPTASEFPEVVERHGAWNEELSELHDVMKN